MPEGSKVNKKGVNKAAQTATTRLSKKIAGDINAMQTAILDLEKRIIQDARKLRTSDLGLLMGPRVNLKQAQKLHTALTYQFEELYGQQIRRHVRGYNQVANWVLDNFKALDIAAEYTDIDKTMIEQLRKQTVIDFTALGTDASNRIAQSLYNSIATQAPMETLVTTISAALTGRLSKSGRPLSTYAAMYANDATMNFYNSVSIEKGRELGMRWFRYSGTIMANTRDFCAKRAGRVYSTAQINSWDHKWSGKRGPALVFRGGWNCRHHWQPVRKEWIEEKRAIKEKPMTSIGRMSNCVI